MWTENRIFLEDLEYAAACDFVPWDELAGRTFFVTGATGLIGSTLVSALAYQAIKANSCTRVVCLVRDGERAAAQFSGAIRDGARIEFTEGCIETFTGESVTREIDYAVHGACPTASRLFAERPVETIRTIVGGTDNFLRFSAERNVMSAVFLSSMEVYGEIRSRGKLSEENLGRIDIQNLRSSYPEAKRLAENLCACYAGEYGLNVKALRLAQTFGPGVRADDNRVFAYMMRCALGNKDIELKTSGEKENPYLYTMDAVTAILILLAKGAAGGAYNAANEETYCSVREMGRLVLDTFGKKNLKVLTDSGGETALRLYPPPSAVNLSTGKLAALGWRAGTGLAKMYGRTARSSAQVSGRLRDSAPTGS